MSLSVKNKNADVQPKKKAVYQDDDAPF